MTKCSGFRYTTHAVKRMIEKNITPRDVEQTLLQGETIQKYDDDKPFPSRLILNFVDNVPLHVVVAQNANTGDCIIITCYQPDAKLWTTDFKAKK